jgi:hypothetical protein
MRTSLGCWVCQTKKAVLFRGIFLRAVCCSDTQGLLDFPWPPKRGWAKTCSTLPWPIRGWSLQFVFAVLAPRSPIGASGCQGCVAPSGARPGLDAGASGDYRAWPSKDGKPQRLAAGQGSGPRAAPTREASPAMGSLPQRPDPRHTARPVKDQLTNTPLRPGRGLGVPNPQGMRQPAPALPGASVPVLHAQCLLPTSTDGQDRTPPQQRRDHAADHQNAGKPLCGRVQRPGELARSERNVRAATPARAQAPI